MIDIRGVYKRYHGPYGGDWVLKDVNILIPAGKSVGVVGPNGAGKSTLLRLIGGMDVPDKGKVIRNGRVSWPIGLAGGFKGTMTGRQNVKFVARVHGIKSDIGNLIKQVESFAEIGKAFDDPVNTYSSGMRSRLAFGLSLAFEFDIYISDEATAVGDRAFKAKARDAFRARVGQASLIMVSHGEGTLKQMCDAGIYINKGQAVWYDDIDDAISAYHKDSGLATDVVDDDDDDQEFIPVGNLDADSLIAEMKDQKSAMDKLRKQLIVIDYRESSKYEVENRLEIQEEKQKVKESLRTAKKRFRALRIQYKSIIADSSSDPQN